ncbi:MAG: hypothetical protein IJX61_04775 [Ruminococcus sp.]|nr:hypothetical protein [Ruminococcus sp.]
MAVYQGNVIYFQPIDTVYRAVLNAASTAHIKVEQADPYAYYIKLNMGVSLFTWGETVTVNLYAINDGRTSAIIVSKSNLGIEIAASSQNKKNVDKVIKLIQNCL